ncbi:MAG: ABC transporter substrate-binding protein [Brucellaceae bacterium]|jgi:dipeptide transport system substrate-binding protein|nr:ABC transporter substrate-binding protein [Brucellaceae bacterium]
MNACTFRGLLLGLTAMLFASTASAKTLVYCTEGSPENFNPQINTTGTSLNASRTVFNRLVDFEPGSTKIRPSLAESWDISPDGLVYTFHLRKNVPFQTTKYFKPSRTLNADDVLETFNRMWKKDHPYYTVSGGAYYFFNDMGFPDLIKSIEKTDDNTVKFTLNKPDATFLASIGMTFASIHSKEYMDAMLAAGTPTQVDQMPVGTGPFKFLNYQKDATIRYEANPDYYRGKPKLDRLVFTIIPDATVRMAKVQAGECDIAPYPNPADIPNLKKDPNIVVHEQEGLNLGYVAFNTSKKPFDDKRVRQALIMAVDREAILKAVFRDAGTLATNPIPPTIWSFNKAIKPYPYDVEKAKNLLKEAGVDKLSVDLWAMPVTRPYNPDARKLAEMMQADFAKVGVTVDIKSYEWGEYRKRLQAGEHTLGQYGWIGDNGDPDNFMYVNLSCENARPGGQNLARWCNQEYSDLVAKAKTISDVAERTKLYERAQEIFHEEAPWLPTAYGFIYIVTNKKVKNYSIHPLSNAIFEDVDIEE